MKKSFVVLFFVVILMSNAFGQVQFISDSLDFEGNMRHYYVFLPQNYQPNMPLLFGLHGFSMTFEDFMDGTLLHEFADTSGFVLVMPHSLALDGHPGWNNGLRRHTWVRSDTISNDVGFISALIDTMYNQYNIDMSRIYCCGFSMGGAMSYRLIIELGHRFAAMGAVAGKMNDITGNLGSPIRPFPVMHFHGTDDDNSLYGPGEGNEWSVQQIIDFWTQNNNCSMPPDTIDLPDIEPSDSTTVQKISFTGCSDSANFIHFKILRGGHTWPGLNTPLFPNSGNVNRDIEANVEMWNFFQNYTNPLVNIAWTKDADITPRYMPPQGDTLFVKAYTVNPQNHAVSVIAKISGISTAHTDSIILYDDGMHGDENPNDNIWGNSQFLNNLPEDQYYVNIFTNDQIEGTSQKFRKLHHYLLKKGPVVLDHYRITSGDTIPHHTNRLKFEFALRNEGTTASIDNLTSQVVSLDTFSIIDPVTTTTYDIIPVASTVIGNGRQYIEFDLGNDINIDSLNVRFAIKVSRGFYLFWTDTFSIFVHRDPTGIELIDNNMPQKFILKQNHPNPFNPSTKIKFTLPKSDKVRIQVFNLLGQKVTTLLNKQMPAGSNEVEFNGQNLSSGIYYYKIEAGEYQEVRKMILMK